jgi:signal transduction histidine kinase
MMKVRDIIRVPGFRWAGPLTGPLGRRLLAGLLFLSLVPLVLSNGLGYLRSTGIIEGLIERYLHGIADLQSLHVRDQLEWHTLFLRELAKHDAISEVPRNVSVGRSSGVKSTIRPELDVSPFLEERLGEVPAFEALYVFTSDGTIIASAPLPPADLGFWIGPPLQEPRGVFEIVREPAPPRAPRLRLAVPLEVHGDTIPGWYVGGSIQVLGPSDFVQLPQHTAGAVETFIVAGDGVPIFISHPHGTIDYSARLATPLLDGVVRSSMVYPDRLGIEVIGTIVAVPDYPWRLITEVPVSDALQELRELRAVSLWLGWLLTALVVALALVLAGWIVVPVRRLVSATRRLAAGDLGARVQVRERNEIGELGVAFNDMASELERTSSRVQELHEREIERAGQLATVGELASGVAHEIKNPLQGISGGLDLVMRHTQDQQRLQPVVDEMTRQVARVDVAVKDLLAFARPATPNFAPVDINQTLERALTLVRPTADRAGVCLEVNAGDVPTVFIDEEMISQSLVNLVMNGVQATEADGCVTVSTRSGENGVEIRIKDTGEGIPPDQIDHIFKPFFTTKHQGTGLGLSITRTIIERHEGTLSVESNNGKGTTFTVVLPLPRDGKTDKA